MLIWSPTKQYEVGEMAMVPVGNGPKVRGVCVKVTPEEVTFQSLTSTITVIKNKEVYHGTTT